MMSVIRNKQVMYDMLAAGEFGNTTPMFTSLEEWQATDPVGLWGIRSLTKTGGLCKLNVDAADVPGVVYAMRRDGDREQISPMVDHFGRRFIGEIYDSDQGLRVFGVLRPNQVWRAAMKHGRELSPLVGRQMLQSYLAGSSYSDLEALIERFPGHIIEMTILDRCFGRIPGRNAIIWEVRPSDGSYEKW